MNEENAKLAEGLIPKNYVNQGMDSLKRREKIMNRILSERQLPKEGVDPQTIELILFELSAMDSNNFVDQIGVGEREGRVFSSLVRQRNFGFAHGIGRSGDVQEVQPKAAGSSLLVRLTNCLLLSLLRTVGATKTKQAVLMPVATGMSINLILTTLRHQRPRARYILWSRMDQKSAIKAALNVEGVRLIPVDMVPATATRPRPQGREGEEEAALAQLKERYPYVDFSDEPYSGMPNTQTHNPTKYKAKKKGKNKGGKTKQQKKKEERDDDSNNDDKDKNNNGKEKDEEEGEERKKKDVVREDVVTDVQTFELLLRHIHPDDVLCVQSTSSCFAPRAIDNVVALAALCRTHGVPHVVNNAYGVQLSRSMNMLQTAMAQGRVDAYVQSTDKNLMVPVGGAIVAGPDQAFIASISQTYPGRASISSVIDVFVTLLEMGSEGYLALMRAREANFAYLQEQAAALAARVGEHLLHTPGNPISMAMTLSHTCAQGRGLPPTALGSMLFLRNISGARVISGTDVKAIGPLTFPQFGTHTSAAINIPYLTFACAIGMQKKEVDVFIRKCEAVLELAVRRVREKEEKEKKKKEEEGKEKDERPASVDDGSGKCADTVLEKKKDAIEEQTDRNRPLSERSCTSSPQAQTKESREERPRQTSVREL
eukprot:GCRY01003274.1.p1 GENE.GCRY01003274.1~~GCRY01003274.1.p1  ORF type:complete len:655 (-),score=182.86 GCRY01003274.1:388-2352(-)